MGKNHASAIGPLVERTTRFTMLLHLPCDHKAATVRDAVFAKIATLPEQLRRSLAWDQGIEMAHHQQITIDAGIDVFFCDPASPWQGGTNENTNGLLCQYLPKGTDLSVHSPADLRRIHKPSKTSPGNPSAAEPQPKYSTSNLSRLMPSVATTARDRVPLLVYFSTIVDVENCSSRALTSLSQ